MSPSAIILLSVIFRVAYGRSSGPGTCVADANNLVGVMYGATISTSPHFTFSVSPAQYLAGSVHNITINGITNGPSQFRGLLLYIEDSSNTRIGSFDASDPKLQHMTLNCPSGVAETTLGHTSASTATSQFPAGSVFKWTAPTSMNAGVITIKAIIYTYPGARGTFYVRTHIVRPATSRNCTTLTSSDGLAKNPLAPGIVQNNPNVHFTQCNQGPVPDRSCQEIRVWSSIGGLNAFGGTLPILLKKCQPNATLNRHINLVFFVRSKITINISTNDPSLYGLVLNSVRYESSSVPTTKVIYSAGITSRKTLYSAENFPSLVNPECYALTCPYQMNRIKYYFGRGPDSYFGRYDTPGGPVSMCIGYPIPATCSPTTPSPSAVPTRAPTGNPTAVGECILQRQKGYPDYPQGTGSRHPSYLSFNQCNPGPVPDPNCQEIRAWSSAQGSSSTNGQMSVHLRTCGAVDVTARRVILVFFIRTKVNITISSSDLLVKNLTLKEVYVESRDSGSEVHFLDGIRAERVRIISGSMLSYCYYGSCTNHWDKVKTLFGRPADSYMGNYGDSEITMCVGYNVAKCTSPPVPSPSMGPSKVPVSSQPSGAPTGTPVTSVPVTSMPSAGPSGMPSKIPSTTPSGVPTRTPVTSSPTMTPATSSPTLSVAPSMTPDTTTVNPSATPTSFPVSANPSMVPVTTKPSGSPSRSTVKPTSNPTSNPLTSSPTSSPNVNTNAVLPGSAAITWECGLSVLVVSLIVLVIG